MAKKQAIAKENAAAPAPPAVRAAKPKTPRVTASKHIKPAVHTQAENAAEVIEKIAYSYWESRGRQDGSALEDWVRAEREYTSRASI
jgi:Protein of unknown function (DUF2934)